MASVTMRLLVVLAVVGVGCGEIVEPEAFSLTTVAPVADSGASSVAAPIPGEPVTTGLVADFFPVRDDDYVPEVLISTSQSVLSVGPTGVQPLVGSFAGLNTTRAFDDLLGGLVVQRGIEDGEVIWLPAQGEEPAVLDESGARLLDVGYSDGSPIAVVALEDRLEQIRLVDAERFPLPVLEDGEEVLALSSSGGLHALAVANVRCGEVRFFNAAGDLIDLNGPGEPDCPVPRRPAYGAVGLSPDGSSLAYTVVSYRNDGTEAGTQLVVRDLESGSVFFRTLIGDDGDRITAVTYDGDRVAYLLVSSDQTSVLVQDLRGDKTVSPVDLSGVSLVDSVSFARLPLADG